MKSIWSMGHLLQRLVAEVRALTRQGESVTGATELPGRVLHVDPDGRFRLVLSRFAPDQPTSVHSHKRVGYGVQILWQRTGGPG